MTASVTSKAPVCGETVHVDRVLGCKAHPALVAYPALVLLRDFKGPPADCGERFVIPMISGTQYRHPLLPRPSIHNQNFVLFSLAVSAHTPIGPFTACIPADVRASRQDRTGYQRDEALRHDMGFA